MYEKMDATNTANEQEISLLDVLNFLTKYKKMILGVALIAGLLAAVIAMRMPDVYTAKIKIIPPAQVQLIQLVLESTSFADSLAQRVNSTQPTGGINGTRDQLKVLARIKAGKEGVFEVEVDDVDPKRAQALANAYPEELDKLIASMGLSDTTKQRKKIEMRIQDLQEQLDIEIRKLDEIDKKLSVNTNALDVEKGKRTNIAQLKAQLDFILEGDAISPKIMPSLDRLREQLDRQSQVVPADTIRKINSADQSYLEQFSQVKYMEASIEMLKNRQAQLKFDEQVNKTRVLDLATLPERQSKPRRLLIVGLTMLAAVFLTILLMLLKEWFVAIHKQES